MSKRILGVLVTETMVSLVLDGRPYMVRSDLPNFSILQEKLRKGDYDEDEIADLVTVPKLINQSFKKLGESDLYFDEEGSQIFYKKTRLPKVLEKKLLEDLENNYSVEAFTNFISNLMQNPLQSAIEELYLFLEAGNLPITEDGCFLAYKKIRHDYKDVHSGRFDNSVGKIVKEKREQCDTNRNRTCSNGLHFCSYSYLGSMSGQRVIIIKINPKDVISIPSDYSNTKGRCCEYKVMSEITEEYKKGPVLEDKQAKQVLSKKQTKKNVKAAKKLKEQRVQKQVSKFSQLTVGKKVEYQGKPAVVSSEPTRKNKDAWKVEIKVGKQVKVVRCSELEF